MGIVTRNYINRGIAELKKNLLSQDLTQDLRSSYTGHLDFLEKRFKPLADKFFDFKNKNRDEENPFEIEFNNLSKEIYIRAFQDLVILSLEGMPKRRTDTQENLDDLQDKVPPDQDEIKNTSEALKEIKSLELFYNSTLPNIKEKITTIDNNFNKFNINEPIEKSFLLKFTAWNSISRKSLESISKLLDSKSRARKKAAIIRKKKLADLIDKLILETETTFSPNILPMGSGLDSVIQQAKSKGCNAVVNSDTNTISGVGFNLKIRTQLNQADIEKVEKEIFYEYEFGDVPPSRIFFNTSTKKYFFVLGWASAVVLKKVKGEGILPDYYSPFRLYTGAKLVDKINSQKDGKNTEVGPIPIAKKAEVFPITNWLTDNGIKVGQSYTRYEFSENLPLSKVITYDVTACSTTVIYPKSAPGQEPDFIILVHTNNGSPVPVRSILSDLGAKDPASKDKTFIPKKNLQVIATVMPEIIEVKKFIPSDLFPVEWGGEVVIMPRDSFVWGVQAYKENLGEGMATYQPQFAYGLDFSIPNSPAVIGIYGHGNRVTENKSKLVFSSLTEALSGFMAVCKGEFNIRAQDDILKKFNSDSLTQKQKDDLYKTMQLDLQNRLINGKFGIKGVIVQFLDAVSTKAHGKKFTAITSVQAESIFNTFIIELFNISNDKGVSFSQKYKVDIESALFKNRVCYNLTLSSFEKLNSFCSKMTKAQLLDYRPSTFDNLQLSAEFNRVLQQNQQGIINKLFGWFSK